MPMVANEEEPGEVVLDGSAFPLRVKLGNVPCLHGTSVVHSIVLQNSR
jgi:hypothetical protein